MKWKLSSGFSVLSGDVASHTPVGGRLQRSKETPLSHSAAPSEAHARAVCDGRPDPPHRPSPPCHTEAPHQWHSLGLQIDSCRYLCTQKISAMMNKNVSKMGYRLHFIK